MIRIEVLLLLLLGRGLVAALAPPSPPAALAFALAARLLPPWLGRSADVAVVLRLLIAHLLQLVVVVARHPMVVTIGRLRWWRC